MFILSGTCSGQGVSTYQTIATRSGGQVFILEKSQVGEVLQFVRNVISNRPSGSLLFQRVQPPWWTGSFQVLPGTTSLGVSVSCDRSSPSVSVRSPGSVSPTRRTTDRSVLLSYSNPPSGRYQIEVRSAGSCTVSVTASSVLSQAFGYYFGTTTGIREGASSARTRPAQGLHINEINILRILKTFVLPSTPSGDFDLSTSNFSKLSTFRLWFP